MIGLYQEVEEARFSLILETLLNELGACQILRKKFRADSQGFVDVDVLLSDDRVFSYKYKYGSCEVCDDWINRRLSKDQIKDEMLQNATFFKNMESYERWREMVKQTN